jgi:hypothetical protein
MRYLTLDGTDHHSREEQNPMIRRYIISGIRDARDNTSRKSVKRANAA